MQVAPTWNMFKNECIEGWLDGMHGQTLVLLLFAASQYCTENNHITYYIIFTESHYRRAKSFTAQNETQPTSAPSIWQTQAYLQETEETLWHMGHRHLMFLRKPTWSLFHAIHYLCYKGSWTKYKTSCANMKLQVSCERYYCNLRYILVSYAGSLTWYFINTMSAIAVT